MKTTHLDQKLAKVRLRLAKILLIVPMVVFGLWLLKLVYLPNVGSGKAGTLRSSTADGGIFVKILSDQQLVPRGHFDMVDEHVSAQETYQVLCLNCHGTYPHRKEKKTRAVLNFHGGIMDCTVCHVRKDPAHQERYLVWLNHQTGQTSTHVEGGFGKYPAKIALVKMGAESKPVLVQPVSEGEAKAFLKLKEQFTPDQMARAKIKLHEGLSQKPVFCTECHKKDGYLNFSDLGFAPNRVDNLTSNEIARMIENYETFYIPKEIDFTGQ